MATAVLLREVGWRAAAALQRAGSPPRVLAVLSDSRYLTADDEIIWLGRSGATLHGRAMVAAVSLPDVAPGDHVRIDVSRAQVWRPPTPVATRTAQELQRAARALVAVLHTSGVPPGFGALIVRAPLGFPLEPATARAHALAAACAVDDADAAVAAAEALVGLGPGLTPAGDDFVGGAFFARAQLTALALTPGPDWTPAGARLLTLARERTHPVSLALLADLVNGHGHAPLHELLVALAGGHQPEAALQAARRLARIGHSSGWDMLAGFLAGLGGL